MSISSFFAQSPQQTFSYFKEKMEEIYNESQHETVFGQLKGAVKAIDGSTSIKSFYSIKYKGKLPKEIDGDMFWKTMEDKAYHPQKYLPPIHSCSLSQERDLGKVRHFVRTTNGETPESVWINKESQKILFFFEDQGRCLAATNELKYDKHGKLNFIGRYIIYNLAPATPNDFKEYMDIVFAKMTII